MHLSDRVTGAALVGLGALSAYGGSLLPAVPGQDVGPNVFPIIIGAGLVGCGAMIALGIGRSFEAPDEGEEQIEAVERAGHLVGLKALVPPALLILYVLIVETVGFLPTAALVVFAAALALGARLRLAVPVAVLAPVGVHLVFSKLLRVPLPDGVLPAPW
jgi:putative tricarboxylic transport membrane protein